MSIIGTDLKTDIDINSNLLLFRQVRDKIEILLTKNRNNFFKKPNGVYLQIVFKLKGKIHICTADKADSTLIWSSNTNE